MTDVSLLDEQLTTELVTATRESVAQMNLDLASLTASYTKINIEIRNTVNPPKDVEGGLGMSHK